MGIDRAVAALGLGLAAALGAAAVAGAVGRANEPIVVEIDIHYSHFSPDAITVPAGRPITFVIVNNDPIDHEWIVGDAALHERQTTVTFASPGTLTFVCHLPGHEAYGMTGTLLVSAP